MRNSIIRGLAIVLPLAAAVNVPTAHGCTRVVYLGPEGRVLTARSMDWSMPMLSNLWLFPRGMERDGAAGPRSMNWVSKYGSLVVSGYDISTVDGMNEAGLVANMLWLADSQYPKDDGKTRQMSLSIWAQFFMDNFATVAEAVAYVKANPFHTVSKDVPVQPGRLTTVHLSLTDPSGDSAILEWVKGELIVHHGRQYRVMTNDPTYDKQLAISNYWQSKNPREFLPGTTSSSDRFVRASAFVDLVIQSDDPRIAAAAAFSVIRNASVPYGISVPDAPNLSTTRWRVVADHKSKLFYVESAISPNVFWVDLGKLDFKAGANVKKLDLGIDMSNIHSGEVSASFKPAGSFRFEPTD